MGKVVKAVLLVAAIAVNVIPGAGQAISGAIFGAIGTGTFAAFGVANALGGLIVAGVTVGGLSAAAGLIRGSRALASAQLSRLTLTFNAEATRKIVFGETALNTDAVYQEASGTDQAFIDLIVAAAAHKVDAITEIWSEDKMMWSAGGGVTATYSGYLTVNAVLEGTRSNGIAINSGAIWNTDCTLTGCAYVKLRLKRTGNTSKASSPFAAGIPQRLTIKGRGMPVYDPRRDSTAGGSGSHRANNPATWEYTSGGTPLGNNPALQALSFLIGWRVGGVVSVGGEMPIDRLNMVDWIAAANVCDEMISTGAGSQRRYECHGIFSDDQAPADVLSALCLHMNAYLRDTGGKLGIRMAINDLGGALVTFTEDDILGPHKWDPYASLSETPNIVRGNWTDPANTSLFQPAPYPAQSVTSPDGINRTLPLDLPLIQDATRAQRVARQILRRRQTAGQFGADFGPRGWAVEVGQPVRLTFGATRFVSKIFRVASQGLKIVGNDEDAKALCPMVLVEDDASIYAWSSGDASASNSAIAAVSYLPSSQPFLITQGIDIGVENNADVTATAQIVVTVPAMVEYAADYLGALVGSLSPDSIRVARGGTSIKLDNGTSYAITVNGGIAATVDNTNGSPTKGDITLSSFSGNSGSIDVVVTVGGTAQPRQTINYTKTLALPPSLGGGSSKMASDTSFAIVSSTSDTVISDTLTVVVASGESLYGTAPLDYEIDGTTAATRTASLKWQYAVAGSGSWNDFVASTYVTGSAAASGRFVSGEFLDPTPGSVACSQTKATPGAGSWDVRLVAKLSATGRNASFYGTATVEAKV